MTVYEIIGYVASVIIAISMTMSSIVKFRVINLIGALTFTTYGFLIGAYPVGGLNAFIVAVDVYYLYKIYSKSEHFEALSIRPDNRYLLRFLEFHMPEIQKFNPGFEYQPEVNTVSFFILRDMIVAGVFLAHREDGNVLKVGLDYVIPQYRDFKNGRYIYSQLKDRFISDGFDCVLAPHRSDEYGKYLKKLGFEVKDNGMYVKHLHEMKCYS